MKLVSIIFYPEPQLILTKKAPAGEAEAFVRLF